jgi:hypothetical protein
VILYDLNEAELTLQVYALKANGSEKLDVVSGTVRVYYVSGGVETNVLGPTALVNPSDNIWRYNWTPGALPVGEYVAEYVLSDASRTTRVGEDLVVRDIATESRLTLVQDDITIIKAVETGRWKIVGNQMLFYEDDGVTVLLTFNLLDDLGLPTMDCVFERVPVP